MDSTSATNKELLALHNGAWSGQNAQPPTQLPTPHQQQQQLHQHQQQQLSQLQQQPPSSMPTSQMNSASAAAAAAAAVHQQLQMMNAASGGNAGGGASPIPSSNVTVPIITMPSDSPHNQQLAAAGQEKIIRAFGELMRNMARMKQYIRPSMCKPYGKQSEGLQKSKFLFYLSPINTKAVQMLTISLVLYRLEYSAWRHHSTGAIVALLFAGPAHSGQLVEDGRSAR